MVEMLTETEFGTLTAQAYEHLYDLVHLRCHPLADLLIGEPTSDRKERAWQLHHLLLRALDDLDPGPGAPATSVEVRRHQLMVLRYTDGLDPQTTADRLAISRRHFYREHEAALAAVARALWQRYLDTQPHLSTAETPAAQPDRAQLLRQEAERLAQRDHFAYLHEVIPGVLSLLEVRLYQRQIALAIHVSPDTPPVGLDRTLLRQLLLAALSFVVERCADANLILDAHAGPTHVHVRLNVATAQGQAGSVLPTGAEPAEAPSAAPPPARLKGRNSTGGAPLTSWEAALAPVHELAHLGQAEVALLGQTDALEGLVLRLPRAPQYTVLVVDDNRDAIEFFHRVLPYHGYRVVSATSGCEALSQARTLLPQAIILDVMMPDQDGWEVLQVLRNQPETQAIPVVICSVLRAAELAFSMGADAFLAKPITEEALLDVLQRQVAIHN